MQTGGKVEGPVLGRGDVGRPNRGGAIHGKIALIVRLLPERVDAGGGDVDQSGELEAGSLAELGRIRLDRESLVGDKTTRTHVEIGEPNPHRRDVGRRAEEVGRPE